MSMRYDQFTENMARKLNEMQKQIKRLQQKINNPVTVVSTADIVIEDHNHILEDISDLNSLAGLGLTISGTVMTISLPVETITEQFNAGGVGAEILDVSTNAIDDINLQWKVVGTGTATLNVFGSMNGTDFNDTPVFSVAITNAQTDAYNKKSQYSHYKYSVTDYSGLTTIDLTLGGFT